MSNGQLDTQTTNVLEKQTEETGKQPNQHTQDDNDGDSGNESFLSDLVALPRDIGYFIWDALFSPSNSPPTTMMDPGYDGSKADLDPSSTTTDTTATMDQAAEEGENIYSPSRLSKNALSPGYDDAEAMAGGSFRLVGRDVSDVEEEILNVPVANRIRTNLPSRLKLADEWKLLYSSFQHGISLATLYKAAMFKGPSVVVVKTTEGEMFGGFATDHWRVHGGYYGTGECFLFKILPEDQVKPFHWSGKNEYFQLSEATFFSMGCGGGDFGFWIDEKLLKGHSSAVPTFDNEPLTSQPNFDVLGLELWGGFGSH